MPNLPSSLSLALTAGCAAAAAMPAQPTPSTPTMSVARMRAMGPAALAPLLARHDAMNPGDERDRLAALIDQVAAQRHATTSHLYWYTDLARATAAAKAQRKPILALRMLGRLDDDLSCANSRLFRATLYANQEVAGFLRENFVLFWSSERPVPRVTIDYGDGRKLEGTTTGNSAHYVLDETGAVLDVLPGLYAPTAFRTELAASLALATSVADLGGDARRAALRRYHQRAAREAATRWAQLAPAADLADRRALPRAPDRDVESALALAQRATVSKAAIEVPQLRSIRASVDPGRISDDEVALWAAAGQAAWGLTAGRVLDAASTALVTELHNSGPARATAEELAGMLARLEHHLVADSALNELKLRPRIHRHLQDGDTSFATVNAWVYANVFHTPKEDAWLGLLPRTDFTGLPGDGVVLPARARGRVAGLAR